MKEGGFRLKALMVTLSHSPSDSMVIDVYSSCSTDTLDFSVDTITVYAASISLATSIDLIALAYNNCTISVSPTGSSAGEYDLTYTTPMLVNIFSATAIPPVPILTAAAFAEDGGSIIVEFDSETDRAGLTNYFACGSVLSFVGQSSSICQWFSSSQIVIYPSEDVLPGSNISVVASTLRAQCFAGSSLACGLWDTTSDTISVPIGLPAFPITPVISFTYAALIGSCSNLTLDLSSSVGAAGRGWTRPVFTVASSPAVDTTSLRDFLNNDFVVSPPSPVLGEYLEIGAAYTIGVELCNFLGACATTSAFVTVDTSATKPLVTVLGPPERNVYLKNGFSINSRAFTPACDGSTSTQHLSYSWTVLRYGSTVDNSLVSESVDPATFKLSPYMLESGVWYKFRLITTNTEFQTSTAVSVVVSVVSGELVVVLSGGSQRLIRLGSSLTIDGSQSLDEDQDKLFGNNLDGVGFVWSCVSFEPVYTQTCPYLVTVSADSSVATISTDSLTTINSTATVTLTMSDSTRTASGSVELSTLDAVAPEVFLAPVMSPFNPNVILRLSATVLSTIDTDATWSVDDSSLTLSNTTLSPVSVALSANVLTTVYLVLSAHSMAMSTAYRFTLQCQNAFAAIDITTNGPPLYGRFAVEPVVGQELSTPFIFSTDNWYDEQTPITYQFDFVSYSKLVMPVLTRSDVSFTSTVLPSGDPTAGYNISCKVTAFDSLDAFSVIWKSIIVDPSSAGNTGALLEALASKSETGGVDATKKFLSVGASAMNRINISEAPNCAGLNRLSSFTISNSCGDCLSGYLGDPGPLDTACALPGAAVTNKTCSPSCSAHGTCVLVDVDTLNTVDVCLSDDASCAVACVCDFGGNLGFSSSCVASQTEYDDDISIRLLLVTKLLSLIGSEDASAQTVTSWANTLASITQRSDALTPDIVAMVLDTALAIVTAAVDLGTTSASVESILGSVDTATTLAAANNATTLDRSSDAILELFTQLALNSMVVGEAPDVAVEWAYTSSVQVSEMANSTVALSIPLSAQELASGRRASKVNINPNAPDTGNSVTRLRGRRLSSTNVSESVTNTFSSSLVETTISQYGVNGTNFTSNPIAIQVVTVNPNDLNVTLVMQIVKSATYATYEAGTVFTTECLAGDSNTSVYNCPGDVEVVHACNNTAGTFVSTCPLVQVFPECQSISGQGACSLVDVTETNITCTCSLGGTTSGVRRRLAGSSGVQSVQAATMVVSLVDDLTSTFTTTPDPEELLSKTIMLAIFFGLLWGMGGLAILLVVFSQNGGAEKTSKVAVTATPAAACKRALEQQRNDLVSMREYVYLLLPSIYDTSVSLSDRIKIELLRCHKYLVLFAPTTTKVDKRHRVRMVFQVFTTQTIFLFLIAWIYDLDVSFSCVSALFYMSLQFITVCMDMNPIVLYLL